MHMTYDEIAALVKQGESDLLEFKNTTSQLDKAGRTLCGFLNGQGGMVLIGVTDKGSIGGQEVADSTKQELADILNKFEPSHDIHVSYVPVPRTHREVIVLQATPHDNIKPYSFDGRSYKREQSTTRVMAQTEYQRLLLRKQMYPTSWDGLVNLDYTVEELDKKRILEVLARGIKKGRIPPQYETHDPFEALQYLKLIKEKRLTNAAVVLFGQEMRPYLIQCMVKLAAFSDDTRRHFIDSKQECGNLFDLVDRAIHFISQHTKIGSYFLESQLERVDVPDYPPLAIREALINAFCHRDYAHPSGSVVISIYPDSLEITSFGRLPLGLTADEIIHQNQSIPRNAHIADVLYRCGYIEKYGTGFQEILKLCQEAHMKPPVFQEKSPFFSVLFHKAGVPAAMPSRVEKQQEKAGYPDDLSLSLRQNNILQVLAEHELIKNQEILDYLNEKISPRTLREDLKVLREKGYVSRQGSGKSTVWCLLKST